MRKLALLICSIALAFARPANSHAAGIQPAGTPAIAYQKLVAPELPPVVILGLEAYRQSGAGEAVKAWMKNSPMDFSREGPVQVDNLRSIERLYGSYQHSDVYSVKDLSPRVKIAYIVFNYERGPLYAKFSAYHAQGEWILTAFEFNTDEEKIFPLIP